MFPFRSVASPTGTHIINGAAKILILGAQGNLGTQLARVLGNEYRLLLWDRDQVDATDFASLSVMINEHRPNIIINTVAYNAVDKCEEDAEYDKAMTLNGELPGVLSELAIERQALLIHFVSDYIFSGDRPGGYREDDEPRPINRYGETKWRGEKAVLERANRGLKYYLIRTSKLFGPAGTSQFAKPSFFDTMLRLSRERETVDVVDGEESCFTYTPDLARSVKGLIESDQPWGVYHLVNAGPATWYQAAGELFRLSASSVKVNPVTPDAFPRPAKRPAHSVLLNTKLEALRDYREALEEYLELITHNS